MDERNLDPFEILVCMRRFTPCLRQIIWSMSDSWEVITSTIVQVFISHDSDMTALIPSILIY